MSHTLTIWFTIPSIGLWRRICGQSSTVARMESANLMNLLSAGRIGLTKIAMQQAARSFNDRFFPLKLLPAKLPEQVGGGRIGVEFEGTPGGTAGFVEFSHAHQHGGQRVRCAGIRRIHRFRPNRCGPNPAYTKQGQTSDRIPLLVPIPASSRWIHPSHSRPALAHSKNLPNRAS